MDGSIWVSILAVLACFVFSGFFSGSETALTASSRARMHALEKGGDKRATLVNRLLTARERLIGGILIGNNVVNTLAASLTTGILLSIFGEVGIVYATIVVSIFVIVFSEILPKTVAINYPDKVALIVAKPISWIVALFGPITLAIEAFIRGLLSLFGIKLGENTNILSATEELRGQVDLLHKEGGVAKAERDMLGGLLDLRELAVEDVMVHRTRMRMIDADLPPDAIVREVLTSPHTRLPLWRGRHENIVGILHAKDLLRALDAVGGDASKLKIDQIALEPWFVPDRTSLRDQLRAFLTKKTHFALVVDEYGEVQGLVTLEDIIEEIVGDIKDEHDVAVSGVRVQVDGSVNVDGSVPIRDLNRVMEWNLPDEEATTIAGLVIHEAQLIPETGQAFTFHGFRFQVLRKTRNRITLLRITPLELLKPRRTQAAAAAE
ncbi:HlyC/CorC family transporter [Salinarimonas ramus]|uniref:Membrane protein n=1 Tax=Salinarimonas ramus TaxID=690164 RepID=A0A917QJ46_9HYPH|nr:HlyC/CorC family transporter [Salinarimonas ramus]GGK52956.1 membrane protein [Salinarimonas ramus]